MLAWIEEKGEEKASPLFPLTRKEGKISASPNAVEGVRAKVPPGSHPGQLYLAAKVGIVLIARRAARKHCVVATLCVADGAVGVAAAVGVVMATDNTNKHASSSSSPSSAVVRFPPLLLLDYKSNCVSTLSRSELLWLNLLVLLLCR